MDARFLRAFVLLTAVASLGAGHATHGAPSATIAGSCRSEHFVVSAPTTEFARQVCALAERYRRDLAIEWLGQELPNWSGSCPIRVTVGPQLGAGGATSFAFVNGQPIDWQMTIQGSRERILDSVLPHEITHTIMATHFGRPLPRWADEGAATSVEHISERSKQQQLLIEFLTTNRGIAFNHMFAMREYPPDILPLYSQGYSLARFLIAQHGKRAYVQYIGDGMRWNNWTAATQKHYGLNSLSSLQIAWLDWVRQGSPATVAPTQLASQTRPAPAATAQLDHAQSQKGWYSRQRDIAARQSLPDPSPNLSQSTLPRSAATVGPEAPPIQQMGHPQAPQGLGQIILPPSPCAGGTCPPQGTVWR